jgi:[NiFe] hydrogenase large subunit
MSVAQNDGRPADRVLVEVSGGKVVNAWSSGQMFRGIELILQGRDPRDAHHFVQRSCGV